MKKMIIFLSLSIIFLGSCSICSNTKADRYPAINTMLDYYVYHYGDYPTSLNELENYFGSGLYDSTFLDTISLTIRHLKEDSVVINWLYDDCFPQNHLLILKCDDTIVYRTNDNRFPSIDDIIYWYTDSYGKFPSSSETLSVFMNDYVEAKRTKVSTIDTRLWEYDNLTLRNFQKCEDLGLLNWSVSEKELLITIQSDTIADWSSMEIGNSLCQISPNDVWSFYPRFYDRNGKFLFCDDSISEVFVNQIRELRYGKGERLQGGINGWHILHFKYEEGLQVLCPEDDVNLKSEWCCELESFVKSFSETHNFGEVIFITPIFE